jgi:hypothetical protein
MTEATDQLGRRAERSDLLDHAVRVGLVSYGIVHLLLAWLAAQLALGDRSGPVTGNGALHQLATTGLGRISLYVVAAGFAALVVWQLIEALLGHRSEDEPLRTGKRIASAGKAVVYGVLGVAALRTAVGSSSGSSTDTATARLMAQPFGAVLVALVGLVLVGVALGLLYRGWTEGFLEDVHARGQTGHAGTAYTWFGKVGYLSKAVALGIVAGMFFWASVTNDPDKSGGLDQALLKVLQQPYGGALLMAIAAGIACFGLFCFAWARHLDR